jgi:LmbE family N-acetylglucosaminyl deacetylase
MIIVAPHPDDELIGCFSLLKKGEVSEVWYVFDHSIDNRSRMKEALQCADTFKFKPIFLDGIQDLLEYAEKQVQRILVIPSIHDSHPQHRLVNQICRKYACMFYSVDLEYAKGKEVLAPENATEKKLYLDDIYSGQKSLWESNASYYLFENIVLRDYTKATTARYWLITKHRGVLSYWVTSDVHMSFDDQTGTHYTGDDLADALISAGATAFSFNVDDEEYRL